MISENYLISKIIEEPSLWEDILNGRVTSNHFIECRNEYDFITNHYATYGNIPTPEIFRENYPVFEFKKSSEGVHYWIDRLKKDNSVIKQSSIIEDWLTARKDGVDSKDLSLILRKGVAELSQIESSTKDVNLKDVDEEERYYKEKKNNEGLMGIPLGLRPLDEQIGGAKKSDLGVIMGPPENMKTWLLLYCAYNAWVYGENVLVISKEMTETDMRERVTWFDLRCNFTSLERGLLGRDEDKYFNKLRRDREERGDLIISGDDGEFGSGGGVQLIASKVDRYKPSILFIDGAYLLTDDRGNEGWQKIQNVFRDLKTLARVKEIPIIVTTQPQRLKDGKGELIRRKLTMDDVGGSFSISQDSDYMVGVRKLTPNTINIYKIKIRRGKNFDAQFRFDLDDGIVEEIPEGQEVLEEEISEESVLLYD